ncbi:glycosyltransferase family 2 protein [Pedobacter sandarakinus]|uniref:glycosyltransferase family 2 protein n=1 Tax=Pedobacter sandarakinus TaxID=353156 RepID=UPI0022458A0D|nr:glycosyltransferase [Pedobacter sandarakinus]MCX2573429.1 glycosyltransferase [Pedobacter sandarakinus]
MESPIKVDVIILSFAKTEVLKDMTAQTVKSLIDSEDHKKIKFNIIVIESNHSIKPFEYFGTETIYSNQKFGYHRYMNIGINRSNNSYICICNNDLLFHKNWCSEILKVLFADETIDSASPFCSIHHPKIGLLPYTGIYSGYTVRKEITGWCLFFKRNILKKTGKLDEKFTFWYADNDYANTLQKHKIRHCLVSSSIVDHLESKTLETFNHEQQLKMTTRERFYYEYKWEGRNFFSYLNRLLKSKKEINRQLKGKN